MIESAEIRNFRCFELAKLQDCRTINVVVGRNAGGKTALLESLFLGSGASPEIVLRLRKWRGFEQFARGSTREIDQSIWRDIFNGFDLSKVINIKLEGTDAHERSLRARYKKEEDFFPSGASKRSVEFASQIEFNYKRPKSPERKVTAHFADGEWFFRGVETIAADAAFFASGHPFSNQENVDRFSKISKARHEDTLVRAISNEFGFINGIEVLHHAGEPTLHVDTPWFQEKIPLSAISSGVAKLVYLVIAVVAMPNSVLMIDEIENGFYYERFPSIWGTLYRLCKDNDVQLFASTHSWECLEGLKTACSNNPDDISFIRTSVTSGKGSVEQFHGSTMLPAMATGEIR